MFYNPKTPNPSNSKAPLGQSSCVQTMGNEIEHSTISWGT